MMQTSVPISEDVLQWIMARVRLESLPPKVAANLEKWSEKRKLPTFNQIEDASKATGIPLGYFFLETPPQEDLALVEYRTIDSIELINPSRELIDTMHNMKLVQDWMHEQLFAEGVSELPFIGSQNEQTGADHFATFVRESLNLKIDWFKQPGVGRDSFSRLRTAMSTAGVIVMTSGIVENNTHRPLDINEFRAFAMADTLAPLIFINGNDSENGKLFSLLHEFAHLCLGESSLFNERYGSGQDVSRKEVICNAAAAEILVPQILFVKAWQTVIKDVDAEEAIRIMARDFKCGMTVIARRAMDNGFIGYPLYKKIAESAITFYNEQRQRQKETSNGGDFYKTVLNRFDPRFLKMLTSSVATGKTLYSDAFRLTNTNRFTFAKLAEQLGGGAK